MSIFKSKFLFLNLILICLIILSIIYFYDKEPKFKLRANYDKKRVVVDLSQPKASENTEDKVSIDNNEKENRNER